ncbi:MAG TPA: DUF4830 domain-containing protein [Candidatus Galloscillospira stercoripullorum]|nr:DUF4830 domain-containing protein [Candidatus Galloscillospira stercoripullorum]
MFIFTAKLKRERVIAGAVALVALGAVVAVAVGLVNARGAPSSSEGSAREVKTNEDRVAYLESFGWTVESEPIAVEELLIPEQFDETYKQYLDLLSSQGFDLTQYAGKRVKRYTYVITNYPTGEKNVQAGLLIYRDTVVGGDVLSSQLGGFIHGLEMPQ